MLIAVLTSIACGNVVARKYEYEEEVFLSLDGSATVYVNASVPALVALRGMKLPLDPRARLDRQVVRELYETPVSQVGSVTTSRREGRRYVHLRLTVPDARRLAEAAPFAWSSYQYHQQDAEFEFTQTMRAAAGQDAGNAGWDGSELVAVRLHLPSKITFHNSPSRKVERGNIVVWEQLLSERQQERAARDRGEDGNPVDPVPHPRLVRRDGRARGDHVHRRHLVCKDPAGRQPATGNRRKAFGSRFPFPAPQFDLRTSIDSRTSASVFSSFVSANSPKPEASDRASMRSTLLCTTPSSVTRPRLTTTRIGGLAIAA